MNNLKLETNISKDQKLEDIIIRTYKPKVGHSEAELINEPILEGNFINIPYKCKTGDYKFGNLTWRVTGCLAFGGGFDDTYFLSVYKGKKELNFKSIQTKKNSRASYFYDIDDNVIYRKKDLRKNKYLRQDCGPVTPHMIVSDNLSELFEHLMYSPFTKPTPKPKKSEEELAREAFIKEWAPSNLEMPHFCVGERVLIEKWNNLPKKPNDKQLKDYKDFYNFMKKYSKEKK